MAGGAADEGDGFDFFSLLDSASSDDLSVVIAIGNINNIKKYSFYFHVFSTLWLHLPSFSYIYRIFEFMNIFSLDFDINMCYVSCDFDCAEFRLGVLQ